VARRQTNIDKIKFKKKINFLKHVSGGHFLNKIVGFLYILRLL